MPSSQVQVDVVPAARRVGHPGRIPAIPQRAAGQALQPRAAAVKGRAAGQALQPRAAAVKGRYPLQQSSSTKFPPLRSQLGPRLSLPDARWHQGWGRKRVWILGCRPSTHSFLCWPAVLLSLGCARNIRFSSWPGCCDLWSEISFTVS